MVSEFIKNKLTQGMSVVKKLPANAGGAREASSIPGSG